MLLFLMAAFLSVKEDAVLRSGCSPDDPVIAKLARTDAVQVKFRLNGDGGSCYKVATPKGEGYLPGSALESTEEFEQARLQGGELITRADAAPAAVAEADSKDPQALAMAGMAAYKRDDVKKAIEYWKASLDLRPSPPVQTMYEIALKEVAADRSADRKFGDRFVLRYDGTAVSGAVAERMLAALEEGYTLLSNDLGCVWTERITAIVQTPADYRKASGAPDWSGGRFDGRIRIALLEGDNIGPQTRRAFAHELTHACLASIGPLPIWLHEGLAQKMAGDALTPAASRQVASLIENKKLPRVDRLTRDWFLTDPARATQAYLLALAATEVLWQGYTPAGVRTLLRNPDALPAAAGFVNSRLTQP